MKRHARIAAAFFSAFAATSAAGAARPGERAADQDQGFVEPQLRL